MHQVEHAFCTIDRKIRPARQAFRTVDKKARPAEQAFKESVPSWTRFFL